MKIETAVYLDTTLTKAENCYDEESADNLADFLNEQLNNVSDSTSVELSTDFCDSVIFNIALDKYCIDSSDFKCKIKVWAEIENEVHEDNIYKYFETNRNFLNKLSQEISEYSDHINQAFKNFKHPYKETFKFTEDGDYYIRMNPYESYAPEFTVFSIYEDLIDSDDFRDNLYVH